MSTLQDFATADAPDEDNMCEHDTRTLDEDPFECFMCWMLEQGSDLTFCPDGESA